MIIDVGANFGEFAIDIAKRNANQLIVAIEPIPELCSKLIEMTSLQNISNLVVLQCAIDINERVDYLNVATHDDWGVSSLLDFDREKIENDSYWKTRSDMYFDKRIKVQVKRLETLISEYPTHDSIDFLKIDVQGLDLNVLKSVGKFTKKIQAGMLEVSASKTLGLYKNENNDLKDVLIWLEENNFESYRLKPNDPASNEFNLYFCKKGLNPYLIEENLSLCNLKIYDGKFFWHFPSQKLEDFDERYRILEISLKENKEKIGNLEFLNTEDQNEIQNLELQLLNAEMIIAKLENKLLLRIENKVKKLLRLTSK